MLFIKLTLVCVLFCLALGEQKGDSHDIKPLWESLSDEQKKEMTDILKEFSLTKAEIRERMNDWVEKSGDKNLMVKSAFSSLY
jgi:hypothetical protein